MDLVNSLKLMKRVSKMTTKDVAEKSGVPEPTLEKIFSGATADPKVTTMTSIVHAMGFTLDDLQHDNLLENKEKSPAPDDVTAETGDISIEALTDFLIRMGFVKDGADLSDDDFLFLQHIFGILDSWFTRQSG